MKAARLVAPKQFDFVELDMPQAGDGQCLIKLERVSVCGSDIRHGYGPIEPEEHYPMVPGRPCHELAGVIVESRTDAYHEGQRVIVIPESGTGGLLEYMVSHPGRMILLPDEGPLDEWVMCQPPGTVLYSCKQMGSLLQKNVVVLGQGSIGLSFTMLISRMGARKVITVEPLEYRREKSRQMGATHTINPDTENVQEAVLELTDGQGADVVVEAAGYPECFGMTFNLVRQFGTIIIFGIVSDEYVPVHHDTLMRKQPTIIPTTGARSPDPISQIQDLVDLRHRGWCEPANLITHRLPFSEVQQAYDMYEQRQDNIIKVVMDINQ